MTMHQLRPNERLRLHNRIDSIFMQGKPYTVNPVKMLYTIESGAKPGAAILVTVPRRKFKKAVVRNRIKRLMRESYRLNKNILADLTSTYTINLAFIYTGSLAAVNYAEIEACIVKALNYLAGSVQNGLKNAGINGK